MKYKLMIARNRETGEIKRMLSILETGEIVTEEGQPQRYLELRKRAITNRRKSEREQAMKDLGLNKVKGGLGGTYWE